MNIFRLTGDLSHLLAILVLLWKIWKTRSCAGKSFSVVLCEAINGSNFYGKLLFRRFVKRHFNNRSSNSCFLFGWQLSSGEVLLNLAIRNLDQC